MNKPHIFRRKYKHRHYWAVSMMPPKGQRKPGDYARWQQAYNFINARSENEK